MKLVSQLASLLIHQKYAYCSKMRSKSKYYDQKSSHFNDKKTTRKFLVEISLIKSFSG